ncbi:MAG: phosphatidylinositol-specific phospholipase C/glycerophosphodiester phosphodiesterase family protein [Aureliella sp.]
MRNAYSKYGQVVAIVSLCLMAQATQAQPAKPLPQAHAHNDYLHERPLLDALDHGFCSVEADIYLVDGQLLVAHDRKEVSPERTLQKLYLEPLKKRVADNGGRVYRDGPRFGLLIDIKSEAEPTYRALHEVLAQYADMLTTVDAGQVKPGAVDVVISGNRPQSTIAAQSRRYCGIDGRVSDLGTDKPADLMPMISDNWNSQFRWRGDGPVPENERKHLREIVERAHAKGRRVRFWATPETQSVWQLLADEQVDLINTDDLAGLQAFLTTR